MEITRTPLPQVFSLLLVAVLVTACDGGSGQTVAIRSPGAGAVVGVPFEVTIEASVPLGTSDAGLHHVHIWFDDPNSYMVVEGGTAQVTSAPDGAQVMHASLRNPDHTEAGAETTVSIVVSGGTSP